METPIYEALKKYNDDNIYPFHMPGHKQGRGLNIDNAIKIDITEVQGLDNLHNAQGIILKSQELTAKTFGADETFFLVNGSSSGIIAAILSCCNPNDKVLIGRNSHRSVYSGIIFSGANPIYVLPEIIKPYGIIGGINPDKIEQIILHENIKAVVITNPTYEGFTSDIEAIAKIVHNNNSILIVDEAHGAHFKFHNAFPKTALEQGADIVIQSVHKTLPSLTQTALLHIQGNQIDREKLKQMLSMVQTSSPSYILMSSIDLCRTQLSQQKFDAFIYRLNNFRNSLKQNKALKLLDCTLNGKFGIEEIDISKIIIYCCDKDVNGNKLEKLLREKYKLQIEMSGLNHIVAITTIADSDDGFKRFLEALCDIDKKLEYSLTTFKPILYNKPIISLNPRQALFNTKKDIYIQDSIGKIAGDFITPYPPGIPILVPGELITNEIIEALYEYKKNNIPILGLTYYNQCSIKIMED